jgi:hypothetical protein
MKSSPVAPLGAVLALVQGTVLDSILASRACAEACDLVHHEVAEAPLAPEATPGGVLDAACVTQHTQTAPETSKKMRRMRGNLWLWTNRS